MDLIIRNAKLRDSAHNVDIGIEGGKISVIEKTIEVSGKLEIDALGNLV